MLEIRFGDRNPRVVLLQILLNRLGNDLKVDGDYGPKTQEAVKAFQRRSSTPVTGSVEPPVFNALFRNSKLTIIDVVDAGDPMVPRTSELVLTAIGAGKPIKLGLMCNGVEQMVNDVTRRGEYPIALLRMTGHGNLGHWMTVSVGTVAHLGKEAYREVKAEYFSYIDLRHFEKLRQILSRLTPYFAKFGSMEHLGCQLGRVSETQRMMQKLSDVWQVPVSAGKMKQDAHSLPRLVGDVYTAFPWHGSLSSWSKSFRYASM
jgi:hypothetical protein